MRDAATRWVAPVVFFGQTDQPDAKRTPQLYALNPTSNWEFVDFDLYDPDGKLLGKTTEFIEPGSTTYFTPANLSWVWGELPDFGWLRVERRAHYYTHSYGFIPWGFMRRVDEDQTVQTIPIAFHPDEPFNINIGAWSITKTDIRSKSWA